MAQHHIPEAMGLSQLPTTTVTGIYFLWRAGVVVYVGQSKTITARIYAHIQDRTKVFDAMSYVACPPKVLLKVERQYIEALMPEYNRCGVANRCRTERPWRSAGMTVGINANKDPAGALGLREDQFKWLMTQPDCPRKGRFPRCNRRGYSWQRLSDWTVRHPDLWAAAKSI